ncbi:hypothetical protein CKO_01157 [Citrobacter koseri ATCC BAA-895]|uniref:Uncharacterized protein n=1 Tax=Citrobacter koseri (strain ATCC BAA-895 / CDC 4225-83 / SGSC4696) TaxID=290338 RepID=A8AFN5_CITK8|nr:hypothetical protein CKO_01157 [Citrobacter koseri ATCC BAA-895]
MNAMFGYACSLGAVMCFMEPRSGRCYEYHRNCSSRFRHVNGCFRGIDW